MTFQCFAIRYIIWIMVQYHWYQVQYQITNTINVLIIELIFPFALLSVSPNIKWCITRMWYHPVISIVIAHKLRIWGLALNLILNLIHDPYQCLIQLIWVANIINILCNMPHVNTRCWFHSISSIWAVFLNTYPRVDCDCVSVENG